MPTGYTDEIAYDIPFEKFVLTCARAFGALIMMRDERLDAPIPEKFEPSSFHQEMIDKTEARIIAVSAMTAELAETEAQAEYQKEVDYRTSDRKKRDGLRVKYEAMLVQVLAWIPPTPDHNALKTFMQNQIEESIKWDCELGFDESEPEKQNGEAWRVEQLLDLKRDLEYHKKKNAEEIERTEQRNAWVSALRSNLMELRHVAT
jgi:hypothetical protein